MGRHYGVKISTKLLNYFELMFPKTSWKQDLLSSEYFLFPLVNNICWLVNLLVAKKNSFLLPKSVLTLDGTGIFFRFYSSLNFSSASLLLCLNYALAMAFSN